MRFLPPVSGPHDALTKEGAKFAWNQEADKAFEALRRALCEAPILRYFDPDR